MSSKGYLAIWAGSALLATGVLAACDAGYEEDAEPLATEEPVAEDDNVAMYEPDEQEEVIEDPAGAEDPFATTEPAEQPGMGAERADGEMTAGQSLETMAPEEIVGMPVLSAEGEEIGEIQEIVEDPTSSQRFAVVDVGGFLGVGQKSIVIGFNELQMGDDRLQSNLTRQNLEMETEYSPEDYDPITEEPMEEPLEEEPIE